MNVSPATVATTDRISLLDQLRGFALLGIVLVNVPFLGITNAGLTAQVATTPLDATVAFLIVTLAQGKFYLLFAFLFGYSAALLLRDDGRSRRAAYARRMLGLFVLGALHAVFFFIGDILMSYAVLGMLLLVFVRRSTRALLVTAAVSLVLAAGVLVLIVLDALETGITDAGIVLSPADFDRVLAEGSFIEAAAGRLEVLPEALIFQVAINWLPAFAMFALGLTAARTALFSEPERFTHVWRRMIVVALVVGLPLAALSGWLQVISSDPTGIDQVLGVALGFFAAPALTIGYVGAFALLTSTRWARGFAPAGKASLSIYLAESVVLSAVFCGWGLGLFGEVSVAVVAAMAIATWVVLDGAAALWLRHHRYGPMEYLLRWVTTLRRPVSAVSSSVTES